MAFQLIALMALGWAGYAALSATREKTQKADSNSRETFPITRSAFVGYDESSNQVVDPLNVTFNSTHLPIRKTEPGPYGVSRNIYFNGNSSVPLFGKNIEKI